MRFSLKPAAVFIIFLIVTKAALLPDNKEERKKNISISGEIRKVNLGSTVMWTINGENRSYKISGLNISRIRELEGNNVSLEGRIVKREVPTGPGESVEKNFLKVLEIQS